MPFFTSISLSYAHLPTFPQTNPKKAPKNKDRTRVTPANIVKVP